jgi:hypothetical protein
MSNLETKLEAILADKRANLLPSNIRIGKTILGVKGTLPAPADNRTVKRFKSYEEMQADPAPDIDDLAVIYGVTSKSMFNGTFSSIIIKENSIILDSPYQNWVSVQIRNSSGDYTECYIEMSPERIYFRAYTNTRDYAVMYYPSEDKLTYTRDSGGFSGDKIDFPNSILTVRNSSSIDDTARDIVNQLFGVEGLTFSGVYKYDGASYIAAPTQFTVTSKSQLKSGMTAYGKNGEITGNGTWLNTITNREFKNTWLRQDLSTISNTGILQYGTSVPSQTLVKHKFISAGDVDKIDSTDCLSYRRTNAANTVDLSGYAIVKKSYSSSESYYTMYNNTPYYVFCGWTYGTYDSNRGYRYANNLFYYVVNLKTNTIDYQGSTTSSIQMMNVDSWNAEAVSRYYGYIQCIGFNFSNKKLYGITGQNGYGWSAGAEYRTFDLNSSGALNVRDGFCNTGSNYRRFGNFVWDDVHFGWIAKMDSWPSGGDSTYYIHYINGDGTATNKLSGSAAGQSIYYDVSKHTNVGGIIPLTYYNSDGSSSTYIFDVYNGKKLSPIITSYNTSYLTNAGDYIFIGAKAASTDIYYSIYKINKSSGAVAQIFVTTNTSSAPNIHSVILDDVPCFVISNKVYDIYGVYKGYYYVGSKVAIPIGIEFTETGVNDIWYPSFSLNTSTYIATISKYTEVFEVFSDIETLPITDGNLAIVCDNSTYTRQQFVEKCYSILLTDFTVDKGPLTQEEYDEALETATEIRG